MKSNKSKHISDENSIKIRHTRTGRIIISVVLVVGMTASGALATYIGGKWFWVLLGVTVILAALQVIYSIELSAIDKSREISFKEAVRQIEGYRIIFDQLPRELDEDAKGINDLARNIRMHAKAPEDRWNFDNCTNHICAIILSFLTTNAIEGDEISVIYVKKLDDPPNMIRTVGATNNMDEVPDNYMVDRNINDPDAYYDARMFRKGSASSIIKMTPDKVDNTLEYRDRPHEAGKYEQLLFIPVVCEKNKMVGLLEVLCRRNTKIANTESEMKKIQKKLKIFCSILLFLQKSEKAALAIPEKTDRKEVDKYGKEK